MGNDICLKITNCDRVEKIKNNSKKIEKENVEIILLGNIYKRNYEKCGLENIYNLYKVYGERIYRYLDGVYSLIIIDYKMQKLFVFQDYFGSNQNIYYYKDEKKIYLTNELKQIILQHEQDWKINNNTVKQFLKKGFVIGKETLVKDINKIPSKKYLQVDLKNMSIRLKKYHYKEYRDKRVIDKKIYNNIFESICLSAVPTEAVTTISSGYDTNYLLYTLRKNTNKHISAFCIGGKIGRNEVPDAKKICENYENVIFNYKMVNDVSLYKYPEIVFALEGAIYESGIFLQYELARLLKENNVHEIMLGECADQVLNYELYHKRNLIINKIEYNIKKIIKKALESIDYKPYKDPYEMASYKILKKNGILMNYMGVDTQYPYLRQEFIKVAKKVVKKGDMDKEYHKKVIKYILPSNVTEILKKIGGATELKTLFVGNIEFDDLKRISKDSEFYSDKKFDDKYYEIDYYMKIIYIELFKKIFLKDRGKYLKQEIKDYDITYFFPNIENKEKMKDV
ncbi:MAG: hypothetical protein IJE05_00275 [Clostridia bacterium]|nr:hypothetical protein [Clostridia bacterium]